ncbi:MAG: FecR domain-containing protein [Pseudomonadales bacterium]|uniref:FecR family protein n=1 Tax=Marinobacter xestospongiae TaxID=994319 RepID=UPI00200660C2|nr:FecR domain-containing protein [Marinobacter xestospongiae]MCG8516375.1 FecR domain-containing protein [Pseudomonadales bacterium]MCK7567914.1 FecR domain-containing protein [Marinobacter xestospongiae]
MTAKSASWNRSRVATLTLLGSLLMLAAGPLLAEWSIARGSNVQGATNAAPAPRGTDWLYTLKAGEQLDTLVSELLKERYTARQLMRHNQLTPDARLAQGDTLRIPLAWLKQQPDPARALAVSGNVGVVSASDGRQRPLSVNSLIRAGDEIVTRNGNATVELADGSVIRISPNSRLIFNKLTQYGKAGMVDIRLRLDHGGISTQVEPLLEGGARFEVETPSAVAAVRGTVFAMQSRPGMTALQVTEGTVTFGPHGQPQNIPAGYSASVDSTSPGQVQIRRLPPAPQAESLPPNLQSLPAELRWADNGASRYQVDVFDTDSGEWLKSTTVSQTTYNLDYLDNGSYDIQVAALDARGIAGMPASQTVDIDLQARAAQLLSPETGTAIDDDMPEFSWQYRGSNEVARVEISGSEDFSNLIATSEWAPDSTALANKPLRPGQYYWRVVTEAGGNSVASSDARQFVINGTLPPVRILSVNYIDSQVRIFWQSVDTATGYLLQLAEGPEFRNIVKEASVDDTTAALRLIPGRRYFVRLKALSDGPLASRWGPGRELFIE